MLFLKARFKLAEERPLSLNMNRTLMHNNVYKKIKSYHLQSTKAQMESSIILSYITSTKLGDGSWNDTTELFILNWRNQVCLYEKHVPPTDHVSDGQKCAMLQNAFHGIEELRQVKNTADHIGTTSGTASCPMKNMFHCSFLLHLLMMTSLNQRGPNAMYVSTTFMMITMMKSSLTLIQHLTLIVLPAPFKPMALMLQAKLLYNLGCPGK